MNSSEHTVPTSTPSTPRDTSTTPTAPTVSAASPASAPATVSTHILDTSIGRPAQGVAVGLSVRSGAEWTAHGASVTDTDGRCQDLPALPQGTTHVRLVFEVEPYLNRTCEQAEERRDHCHGTGRSGAFFPEVTVAFTVEAGQHYHVPLLLNPFGYSVYRGS